MTRKRQTPKKSAWAIYKDLQQDFQNNRCKPVYLFYGGEPYLPEKLQKILINHTLAPEDRDFNLDIIQGNETTAQFALSICQTAPMLVERRIVVIREFDQLRNNKLFISLAKEPNPGAIVLLICQATPKFNADPYRTLQKITEHVQVVQFAPLWRNQASECIREHVKSCGYSVEAGVEQLLIEFLGTGLALLFQEIEKLITYVGIRDPKVITKRDVLQACGQTREINIFELQDAIVQRRAIDAHRITEQLLLGASSRQGEALRIVSILANYFVRLWKLHEVGTKRLPQKELAKRIGISPKMMYRYQNATRMWPLREVQRAVQLLLSVDSEIKGLSRHSTRLIMSLFIVQLLAKPSRHPVL